MRGLCRMKARATRESGNTPDTAGVELVTSAGAILLLSLLFIALGGRSCCYDRSWRIPDACAGFCREPDIAAIIRDMQHHSSDVYARFGLYRGTESCVRNVSLLFGLNALFGLFLDFWLAILPTIPESLTVRIAVWIAAVILLLITVALAMLTRLPMTPCDSFARDMAELLNKDYRKFRTGYDLCSTAVSAGISFLFTGGLIGIGVGTVVYALTLGNGVSFMCKKLSPHVTFKPTYIKRLAERHSKKQ